MNLVDFLEKNARLYPEDIAFVEVRPLTKARRDIDWARFNERTNRLANALMKKGIKKEDKVPDGVSLEDLVTVPDRDDIWAESDLQGLSRDYQKNHYTNKGKMDISGPFPIAAAATRTRDGADIFP